MGQTFAKEYKESITLAYYCINTFLTILGFAAGTIYLWYRDRRDQERRAKEDREHQERRAEKDRKHQERLAKEEREYQERRAKEDGERQKRREQENREYQERREHENREYQERREQENRKRQDRQKQEDQERQDRRDKEERRDQLRQEWRQFTEIIFTDHSSLKQNHILENILKVKKTFDKLPIHSEVTGLDVLRYWLADDHYQNVSNESPQLRALREDLHTIYRSLSPCSSLIDLGEVPKNTKEELRGVVEELGNAAKPFLTGDKLEVALTCLKHFGGGKPYAGPERKVPDKPLEDIVPYVNSLKLVIPREIPTQCPVLSAIPIDEKDYSQCTNFSLTMMGFDEKHSLRHLHHILEREEYTTYQTCIEEFKVQQVKSPLNLTDPIVSKDSHKEVVAKVLHEIRYIHYLQSKLESPKIDGKIVSILGQLFEEVIKSLPLKSSLRNATTLAYGYGSYWH